MSRFYFLRHGLRVSRDEDTLLSKEGIEQIRRTGEYLKTKNITKMFVSPTKRTLHTAQIINSFLHVPQVSDMRLKERMEFDKNVFESFDIFLQEWDKTMHDRTYQPPVGDSATRAGNRISGVLDEIKENGNYVLISHGGGIGDVLRNMFPEYAFVLRADPKKKVTWLDIPEASISEIHKENGSYFLKKVGDTTHLQ